MPNTIITITWTTKDDEVCRWKAVEQKDTETFKITEDWQNLEVKSEFVNEDDLEGLISDVLERTVK